MTSVVVSETTELNAGALSQLAEQSLSAEPRPFLRWAGSKRHLLPKIVPLLPASFRVYWEPFLGAGSLFFLIRPRVARLGDLQADLIETYSALRDNQMAVVSHLRTIRVDKETYYRQRKLSSTDRFVHAARFIYLNKTCWNGLYRVNSKGAFNVPFGRPGTKLLFTDSNLAACATLLQQPGVHLGHGDFEQLVVGAGEGDLVFLDPPYVTGHNNNGFIDYNKRLFSWPDQVRLADVAKKLVNRGAHVIVTNAHHDDVLRLYPGFEVQKIQRASTIASTAKHRRQVEEALLVGGVNGR